jgi:hypothetical protein
MITEIMIAMPAFAAGDIGIEYHFDIPMFSEFQYLCINLQWLL